MTGIITMLLMVLWFFFITRVVMSWGDAGNAARYHQMFHYSNLGNTVTEIILSPFIKTNIFLKELFAVENLYFVLILFAGFPMAYFYPRLLLLTLLPFIGVFLLNDTSLSNVAMQYQVEIFVTLISASVTGAACGAKHSKKLLSVACCTAIFAMVVCGCFSGRFPWSFYNGIRKEPNDCRDRIEKIKEVSPPGSKLQATLAYQAHFIGRNTLFSFSDSKISTDVDYIIIPEKDPFFTDEQISDLIRQIYSSGIWVQMPIDPLTYNVFVVKRVK